MTTAVTIDTHAGWPVEVTTSSKYISNERTIETFTTFIIEPHKSELIYIHDGMSITNITELRKVEKGS